jgi:hypothetical protein
MNHPPRMPNQYFTSRNSALIFAGAFLGLLLSKGMALVPGFGLDDYSAVHIDRDPAFYMAQGRFTQALIQVVLSRLDVTPTSIAWPVIFLFFIFAAIGITGGLLYLSKGRGKGIGLACTAALIGCHPYLTEYFSFRESLVTQGFSFGLLSLIFFIIFNMNLKGELKMSTCIVWLTPVMVLLAGAQQTAFIVLGFFLLAKIVDDALLSSEQSTWKMAVLLNSPVLSAFLVAALSYTAIFILIGKYIVVQHEDRSALIHFSDIAPRLELIYELSKKILLDKEPTLSAVIKYCVFVTYVLSLAIIGFKSKKAAVSIMLASLTMYVGSIFLVSISGVWWPVSRAIYGVGFAIGIGLSLVALWLPKKTLRVFSIAVLVGALGFSFHSSSMLHDQIRLNRWDMWVAGGIAHDLAARSIFGNQKVVLVGASWWHPVRIRTVDGDLNVSALSVRWAAKHLFMEATGRVWNIESVLRSEECNGLPSWPAGDSIKQSADTTYVCLGN